MTGKQKCELLRKIREEIAEANDIVYLSKECEHKVCRRGTCPICEAEAKYLENELNEKAERGEKINLKSISFDTLFDALEDMENDYEEDYPDEVCEGESRPVSMGASSPEWF